MRVEEIITALIERLRTSVPSLRSVELYDGPVGKDIEKVPLRLPAAYVVYDGSKHESLSLHTMTTMARFSVYLVTRMHGPGGQTTGASVLMDEVAGALSGSRLGLEIESIRSIGSSFVLGTPTLIVHALVFETWFESATGPVDTSGAAIKTAHINILESSIVSLLTGTEDTAFPLYRLYDRNISRPFRAKAAETLEILVDQGGGVDPKAVDTLVIPSGHNLDGITLGLKYSDDGLSYLDAVPEWSATDAPVIRTWPELTSRYWKLVMYSPSSAPSIPEVFLTNTYEWERMPLLNPAQLGDVHNIIKLGASDGRQRFLKSGPSRRRRIYEISRCPLSMKNAMLSLWETWGEGKPFWLLDHEGEWIFGSLESGMEQGEASSDSYDLAFDFLEVLS